MKKDLIFAPILLVIGILLGLLKVTGMPIHIAVSVVGVIVLVVYTILTKKEWEISALEIAMRASYGIALISGIVLKIKYVPALGVAHKIFAIVFVVALVVLFVQKVIGKRILKGKNLLKK